MESEIKFRIALLIVFALTMAVTAYHRLLAASSGEIISHKEEGYAFATVLRDPEVLARFKSFGSRPMMTDPKEFAAFIASEIKKWTAVVEAANLRQK